MKWSKLYVVTLVSLLVFSCAIENEKGPVLIFNPFYQDDFYSFPFPNDFRKKSDGKIDMSGYPIPEQFYPVGSYPSYAESKLSEFGNNSPVYFTFTDEIDTSTLPESPYHSIIPSSALILINIDKNCADYAKRVPIIWDFQTEDDQYIKKNTLMLSPLWGFTLEGGCKYAVLGTTDIKGVNGQNLSINPLLKRILEQVETTDSVINSLKSVYSPLVDFLKNEKIKPLQKIAFATVFTTQNPVDELVRIRNYFKTNYEPQLIDINYKSSEDTTEYYYFEGHYTSPNLQYGDPPYLYDGGNFVFDQDGNPVIQREETLRFALTVPEENNFPMPPSGYPLVMYAHGTGGDYKSYIRSGTATNLTKRGLAVIGIDQPLHGPRAPEGTDVEIASFNFFNPDAGRANFRQSVVDSLILTKLIMRGRLVVPDSVSPSGKNIYFNSDRLMFMGHSHGGLTGAMFVSLTDDVKSAVLSGAGGGLSLTILERKDPDLNSLFRSILGIPAGAKLNTFHPGIGIAQMLVEVTDPINYAPFYFKKLLTFKSRNILMTEGMLDPYTPPSTAEAMATAGGIPLIEPVAHYPESYEILGLSPHIPPVTANVISATYERFTTGLLQFPEDGHFAVFNNPIAKEKYCYFLYSTGYLNDTWIP